MVKFLRSETLLFFFLIIFKTCLDHKVQNIFRGLYPSVDVA